MREMKKLRPALAASAALALALAAGCGQKKPELHVYTWSDYIDPDVVTSFEKQYSCRVIIDTFDSNEAMFAKLQAGSTGYDIIMPSSYQIPVMRANGLISRLDASLLPNVEKYYDRDYDVCVIDPSHEWSVPYAVTFTGLAYRKDKIGDAPIDSWAVLDTPALKGRISLLSDMRETLGAALRYLGYSLNSTEPSQIEEAVQVVIGWKRNIAKFDNEQYKTAVASAEFFIGHGYSSDVNQIMLEDKNVGFSLPKEGFTIACDEMVIPPDAPQRALAHAFINYLYDPEVCESNMEFVCAPMPCAPALEALPDDLKPVICPPAEVLSKGEVLRDLDSLPVVRDLYIAAWDRVKAAN